MRYTQAHFLSFSQCDTLCGHLHGCKNLFWEIKNTTISKQNESSEKELFDLTLPSENEYKSHAPKKAAYLFYQAL